MKKWQLIFWMVMGVVLVGCGQGRVSQEIGAGKILLEDKKAKTTAIRESKITKGSKNTLQPEIFNQINDYDSLGRPYIRWIEFRDTVRHKVLKKIDVIEKDNPFVRLGLRVHGVDENGPQIYYDLGENADKSLVKPFIPEEQYKNIPADYIYPKAMSMVVIHQVSNYLIVNYSFEWGGLEREWIRGEFIGHAVLVYDQKGELKYSKMNTSGSLSYISPSGDFLFFIENKYEDDWEKQTGCFSIYSSTKDEYVFRDCEIHSEWGPTFSNNTLSFGLKVWGLAHRNDKRSTQLIFFNLKKNTFYKIKKNTNEYLKKIQGILYIVDLKTGNKKQLNLSNYEILTK